MHTNLLAVARARRLAALASLPSRSDNVVSLRKTRAERALRSEPVPFMSVRGGTEPIRLAA